MRSETMWLQKLKFKDKHKAFQNQKYKLTRQEIGEFMEYKMPDYTPQEIKDFLIPVISYIHSVLRDKLIGTYLHGSLAMGSFQLDSSDIDLIFVVKEHLSSEENREIVNYLNKIRLPGRSIDVSILLEAVLQNPQYPIFVELNYDYPDDIFANEPDNQVVAHLYEAKERGFCIWGKPVSEVFSKIPAKYYLLSIIDDLKYTRKYLLEDPVYWVLNACRTMAFIKEGTVLSKPEGGEWGTTNLPEKYRNLINQALLCRQKKANKAEISWNSKELEDFAEYIIDNFVS